MFGVQIMIDEMLLLNHLVIFLPRLEQNILGL